MEMAFEFPMLEPHIRGILEAPSTNLNSISAKGVRRQLSERIPTLTPEFLKTNKKQVDEITERIFAQVKQEHAGSVEREVDDDEDENTTHSEVSNSRKRKEESSDAEDNDENESPPPLKKAKKAKGSRELSDAELARQLASELNGRSRRSTGKRRGATNGTPKKRSRKSAATVESGEEDVNEKPKKKSRGGLAKEYILSEPLSALTGQEKLSRPQVVKALWDHIKGNGLQNPNKRQEIICDASFKAIFGVEKIDMFKMNKVLGQHLHEQGE